MPLYKILSPSSYCMIGTWEISESLEQLKEMALAENIFTSEEEIKIEKKQKEHIAARLLLKLICKELNIDFNKVEKTTEGKPYLKNHQCHISYSHTDKYCAAIVHLHATVGIDIEFPKAKLESVAHKFLTEKELQMFNCGLISLCKAWTAKEAVYKLIGRKGISIKSDIELNNDDTVSVFDKKWKVNHEKMVDGYIVAYIIE